MTTTKTEASKNTSSKTKAPPPEYKTGLDDALDCGEALVREVDNIMSSNLPVNSTGKILGEVMSGFQKELEKIRSEYSA